LAWSPNFQTMAHCPPGVGAPSIVALSAFPVSNRVESALNQLPGDGLNAALTDAVTRSANRVPILAPVSRQAERTSGMEAKGSIPFGSTR
jgi:hypothetical protein